MHSKLTQSFLTSAGVLLLATGCAKIISSFGHAPILQISDPILFVNYRTLFWLVGFGELLIALFCFLGSKVFWQLALVSWFATSVSTYRIGLIWGHYQKPCSCLGSLTDSLPISPQTSDSVMKIVLAYLLIGSYAALFWFWRDQKKVGPQGLHK